MNLLRSLLNQLGLVLTALAFAVFVWAIATGEENPGREAFFPDAIPLEITSSVSLVVSSKSSDVVRVRVRAPQAAWDEMKRATFRATVDLRAFGIGSHQAPIQIISNDSRVAILLVEPAVVQVALESAKSRFMDARAEILDAVPLGYSYRPPRLSQTQVTVSGAASQVDVVSEVIAEVYLRGARSPVEREAALIARDAQGNEVKGVTLTPATILVSVPLEQRVGFKDVSIKTVLRGNVASGYWISNIVVNPSSATVVGSADALTRIFGFVETTPIDVNNATKDMAVRAVLALPDGVSILENQSIEVRVAITPILGGQTIRRQVIVQNLRPGLAARISPEQVDLILAGPLPNLQNLSAEAAVVVVDAANLGAGVYPLKPRVIGASDPLKVQSIVPDTIQLTLFEGTPTPPR